MMFAMLLLFLLFFLILLWGILRPPFSFLRLFFLSVHAVNYYIRVTKSRDDIIGSDWRRLAHLGEEC